MTPKECVRLVKFVADRCPAMRMQDGTPEAWYVDLVSFDLADAVEAARQASLRSAFIGIGDIVTGCESIVRMRRGREAVARREAEIAAENPPAEIRSRPVAALDVGRSVPVDDPVRVERRTMLRRSAHGRRRQVEADVAAANEHRERVAAARAELDGLRAAGGETP